MPPDFLGVWNPKSSLPTVSAASLRTEDGAKVSSFSSLLSPLLSCHSVISSRSGAPEALEAEFLRDREAEDKVCSV